MFRLMSPAFEDGQDLAQRYGKEAGNVSPPSEEDAPQGTRSFALALVDIDPMARNYVHWLGSRNVGYYLDSTVALSLLSFVATVAAARHLRSGGPFS